MKKLIHSIIVLMLSAIVFAQAPQSFKYQAVARDASGEVIADQQVSFQISILQNSESGTTVYTETHVDSTNQFGLITLEIGTGTTTDDFTAIDWGNDAYFIQIEMDASGGTSYTLMGTSQLLSVPYALHATTTDSVTGTITETDPVFGVSVAVGITGIDTTNWNNKQNQLTAGTGIEIINNVISTTAHYIGESYGGGIVFYVHDNGQHGLIAATADQSSGIQWYNGSYTTTGATLNAVYAGKANTEIIISNQGAGSYAAQVCDDYSVTVNNEYYDDWYLPSRYELNLMYLQKIAIGGFASYYYWSSTEYLTNIAWMQSFSNSFHYERDKVTPYYVRAVRAF